MLRLASFDIGKNNFAQYVEEFNPSIMDNIRKKYMSLPKKLQRKVGGPMNPEIKKILQEVAMNGQRLTVGVYDFTTKVDQSLDIEIRLNLIKHLVKYQCYWDTCNIFIIEQQYFNMSGFKSKKMRRDAGGANMDAIKLGEATFMWLLQKYPDRTILYFGSQYKTQIFGAPPKMTKPQRKQWSTQTSHQIYKDREDEVMIKLYNLYYHVKGKRMNSEEKIQGFIDGVGCEKSDEKELVEKIVRDKQKMDDPSDTLMMAQAFKFYAFIACLYDDL